MSFSPVILSSGLTGFRALERSYNRQFALFQKDPEMARDLAYFRENISQINSAEELVGDYRLVKVVLGAFGLSKDINNRFFIEKVLSEGTKSSDSFANKLSDVRYRQMAEAFGFDQSKGPNTEALTSIEKIASDYQVRNFELAIGESSPAMQNALVYKREIGALIETNKSDSAKWFSLMGQRQLRTVLENALGLPESIGGLDIDQQHEIFSSKLQSRYQIGVSDLDTHEYLDRIIQDYLLRDQITSADYGTSSAANALQLLQLGTGSSALLASRF